MAKQTDITGTFRVPEEAWGRFWNTMMQIDGAEITPSTRVNGAIKPNAAKRQVGKAAEGNTGRCIVLGALVGGTKKWYATELNELMVKAGKSNKSLHGLLHTMTKEKQVKRDAEGRYSILAAGQTYLKTNCSL